MPTRADLVREARTMLGTPFHHQGRAPGIGVDCIGLISCAVQSLGIEVHDRIDYPRTANGPALLEGLDVDCDSIPVTDAKPGDILVFRFTKHAQHVGLLTDVGLLHTWSTVGAVVEHTFDRSWRNRVIAAYRIRGLE